MVRTDFPKFIIVDVTYGAMDILNRGSMLIAQGTIRGGHAVTVWSRINGLPYRMKMTAIMAQVRL